MPKVLLNASTLSSIANAIRTKLGVATLYKPGQMADAIASISSGGITPTGTKQININSNGTTTEDVTNYANVEITTAVPTSQAVGPQFTLIGQSTHILQAYTDTSTAETIDTQISTNVDYVFLLVVITCDGTPVSNNSWARTAIGLVTLKANHNIITNKTLYINKGTVNSLSLSETNEQATYCTSNGIYLVDNVSTIQFQRKATSKIELPAGTYTVKVYGLTSL